MVYYDSEMIKGALKASRDDKIAMLLGAAMVLSMAFMCIAAIDRHWMTAVFTAEFLLSFLMLHDHRKRMKEKDEYEHEHL